MINFFCDKKKRKKKKEEARILLPIRRELTYIEVNNLKVIMKARNIAGFLLEEESERKGTILLLIPNIIV